MAKRKKVYAIAYGANPSTGEAVYGIKCSTWDECQKYIKGVRGAKYKSFTTDEEADEWLEMVKDEVPVTSSEPLDPNPDPASSPPDLLDWCGAMDSGGGSSIPTHSPSPTFIHPSSPSIPSVSASSPSLAPTVSVSPASPSPVPVSSVHPSPASAVPVPHPCDPVSFPDVCERLGLASDDVDAFLRGLFVDVVSYLDRNNCMNDMPFKPKNI